MLLTYEHRAARPYAHEVRTLAGHVVTAARPADHPWHTGISLALAHVGGYNFWGGPTYADGQGYVDRADHGTIRHERWLARYAHQLAWLSPRDERLLTETRRIEVEIVSAATWRLSWSFELTNVSGAEIEIGSPATHGRAGAGYGGLFWRGAEEFRGGRVRTEHAAGEDAVNGTSAAWLEFRAPHTKLLFHADETAGDPWCAAPSDGPVAVPAHHGVQRPAGAEEKCWTCSCLAFMSRL